MKLEKKKHNRKKRIHKKNIDTSIQIRTIENSQNTRGIREKHAPKKYDDYICNQTTRYPIKNHVPYKNFSKKQKTFLVKIMEHKDQQVILRDVKFPIGKRQ